MSDTAKLLANGDFLTVGGTETYMYFIQGFELRDFCGFEIFEHEDELQELERSYLHPLLATAATHGKGIVVDSLVWRASPDYVTKLGYAESDLQRLNQLAVKRIRHSIDNWQQQQVNGTVTPALIAADLGPRGDGYQCDERDIDVVSARAYHSRQVEALDDAPVDVFYALTMTSANETIGLVQAAASTGLPVIVSPTVETDGRLPDGSPLREFIERVDDATAGAPLYYIVNCAHPDHLLPTLDAAAAQGERWLERFKGFRANSSRMSHEELDNSTELDRGNPRELAEELASMRQRFGLKLVGGCCGTDVEHIDAIATATARH